MTLPNGVKAVNLGCGTTVAPGWINIDNSPNARLSKYPLLRWLLWKLHILSEQHYAVKWPESLLLHDLRKKLPFSDASIDYVYSSHVLEHLAFDDGRKLMAEIFRILKNGGVTRIVVPDLAFGIRHYLEAVRINPADAQAAPNFLGWLQLSKPGHRDPHLWMYDAPHLSSLLTETGFTNVEVCNNKQGRVPDCHILDMRSEGSLHIEAEKPGQ